MKAIICESCGSSDLYDEEGYYAISPLLVKLFGDKHWFKRICKLQLDRVVWKLKEQGFPDTPYKEI